MAGKTRILLGIDPGLAHTGWGIVEQCGPRLSC
ncbi:crossover junction endodeoxyribonuclease RuvC, partial [Adlercreutzia sp. DFI.6.23]|nr:crossover junction endodeoxyribonuclease RuvC [Adlercreutzia sp. DFI.6.23]